MSCLLEVEERCRASLLGIINSDHIEPIYAPQHIDWSISVGIKKDIALLPWFYDLWANDENNNDFPWKSKTCGLETPTNNTLMQTSTRFKNIPEHFRATPAQEPILKAEKLIIASEMTNLDTHGDTSGTAAVPRFLIETPKQPPITLLAPTKFNNNSSQIICLPLSSFLITSNLMLSIYSLKYPEST